MPEKPSTAALNIEMNLKSYEERNDGLLMIGIRDAMNSLNQADIDLKAKDAEIERLHRENSQLHKTCEMLSADASGNSDPEDTATDRIKSVTNEDRVNSVASDLEAIKRVVERRKREMSEERASDEVEK